ncbi:14170_t:CDS:2, partial [Racocetra fulgida]
RHKNRDDSFTVFRQTMDDAEVAIDEFHDNDSKICIKKFETLLRKIKCDKLKKPLKQLLNSFKGKGKCSSDSSNNNLSFKFPDVINPAEEVWMDKDSSLEVQSIILQSYDENMFKEVVMLYCKVKEKEGELQNILKNKKVYAIGPHVVNDEKLYLTYWSSEELDKSIMKKISRTFKKNYDIAYYFVGDVTSDETTIVDADVPKLYTNNVRKNLSVSHNIMSQGVYMNKKSQDVNMNISISVEVKIDEKGAKFVDIWIKKKNVDTRCINSDHYHCISFEIHIVPIHPHLKHVVTRLKEFSPVRRHIMTSSVNTEKNVGIKLSTQPSVEAGFKKTTSTTCSSWDLQTNSLPGHLEWKYIFNDGAVQIHRHCVDKLPELDEPFH